jgi:hypothetical protein
MVVAVAALPNRADEMGFSIRLVAGVRNIQDAPVFQEGFRVVVHTEILYER